MRSLFPKVRHFKQDFLERDVDLSMLCEVWENSTNKKHRNEIEKLLELDGLKYISTPRLQRGGGGLLLFVIQKSSLLRSCQ